MTEVASGVHRLGDRLVNFYLVADGERLALVDTGCAGHWEQIPALVSSLGRSLADIEAVVLTHAHTDHIGCAERARKEAGAPVLVHSADRPMATTGKLPKREGSLVPYLRHGEAWKLILHLARLGALSIKKVAEVTTFEDGAELDVPGRPRVLHAPGHSPGSCLLVLPDRGVVFVGDVINLRNPLTGKEGPQLPPRAFNSGEDDAIRSLDTLESVDAETVLAGHGEPWTGGAAAAAKVARGRGPT